MTIALDVGLRYDPRGTIPAEPRQLTGIKSHSEMIAGLDGFRRNLLNSNLPYVPPTDPDDPSAPQRLLARLGDGTGPPGVLLVGAAGVGKTRACFEVANQAVRDGWAVLHVTTGDAAVTTMDLHEAIIGTRAARVLVVLDYLNEYRGIDLPALRHRVLPDAARNDTTVALIASCRPGWHSTTDAQLDLLFEAVDLEPPASRMSAIRDQILRVVAPNAVEAVGLDSMREACGSRPVIAMLIASEAERLCARNELTAALEHVRPAHLLDWLKRRLREDHLIPKPAENPFADDEDEPSLKLQACVAMLLASPQDEESLIACALNVAGLPANHAGSVLGRLRAMKWVVTGPGGLVPVHDLVTDQLVENILLENGHDAVRTAAANRVLDACLVTGRSVGRFANNLNRIIRDLPQRKAGPLREHCGNWLSVKAGAAGEVLARTDDEGAYALGALLDNPAWSPVGFDSWDLVVGPWLQHYAESLFARHLLYKGLRMISDRDDDRLIAEALRWLTQHDTHIDAGFVLGPLLARELDATAADNAVNHTFTWLGKHGTHNNAQFVLNPLLARELDTTAADKALDHTFTWLGKHRTHLDAQFVLAPLLARELDTATADKAVNHVLTWLDIDKHGTHINARFVYNSLLARELDSTTADKAVNHTFAWLDEHGTHVDAQFVLGRLLPLTLDSDRRQRVVAHSLTWIESNGVGSDLVSKFVSRQREITEPVAGSLIQWAGDNPNDEDLGWRLTGVAKWLSRWPHLAESLLTVVERALWALPIESSSLNSQSEMDGVMRYLCKSPALSKGIAAARLDDLMRLWLARPESLSPNCSPGTHFLEFISRVTSLFIVPRNAPPNPVDVLDRIEAWVHQWQRPDGDDMRTAALDCVLRARKFAGQAG